MNDKIPIEKRFLPLLYLISLFDNGLPGRTRLQKLIYLTKEEEKSNIINYPFAIHFYGPYSSALSDDLRFLIEKNIVKEESISVDNSGERISYNYRLTDVSILDNFENTVEKNKIKKVFEKYGNQSLKELLAYVYAKYVH